MAELLPEQLVAYISDDDHTKASKLKIKPITNILDWVQAFGLYVAIILFKQLQRVPDLIGYQALIIDAQREYQGECWIGYDRRFRQRTALQPIEKWAIVDSTLWNLAFAGYGSCTHCKLCFSTSHVTNGCKLASDHQVSISTKTYQPLTSSLPQASSLPPRPPRPYGTSTGQRLVCFAWNENLTLECSCRNCGCEHVCYFCFCNPTVANKSHKAMFCPNWKPRSSQQGNPRLR